MSTTSTERLFEAARLKLLRVATLLDEIGADLDESDAYQEASSTELIEMVERVDALQVAARRAANVCGKHSGKQY